MTIRNYKAVVAELAGMLIQFAKDNNPYHTDVYLYYDEKEQTATLDTFQNVGNNSWLDDDHYTIYTDEPHNNNMWDWYESVEELAEYSGVTEEQLISEVKDYFDKDFDVDEDFSPSYYDVREYLENTEKGQEYIEKLTEAYNEYLDNSIEENKADYERKAIEILDEFINETLEDFFE